MKKKFTAEEVYANQLRASREWKARNKECVQAYGRAWNDANKELRKALKAKWDKENPEKRKEHMIKFKTKMPTYFRDKHLMYEYGMTPDIFEALVEKQDNRCATCGKHGHETQRKRLFVDHCHDTGKIRGLLCQQCNTALGMVDDSIEKLSALISYLREHHDC
jgi:hypothetical protein